MHDRYENFFDYRLLAVINVAIILAAQLAGGGKAFFELGFINVPVLMFFALVLSRVVGRYRLYDEPLQKFLRWITVAASLVTTSFVLEFVVRGFDGQVIHSGLYGAIITLHLASLLMVSFGTFHVLQAYDKLSEALPWIVASSFVGAIVLVAGFATYVGYLDRVPPVLYTALATVSVIGAAMPLRSVGRLIPSLRDFAKYMTASAVFMAMSASFNALHLVAENAELLDIQATYFSHFAFYASMSMLFLGLGRLSGFGAIPKALSLAGKRGSSKGKSAKGKGGR